ncbi:hypothetical protein B0H12DRAFT_1125117 [Mycena haematopus]|nr:hypothetical protein B0H12DRAFT_1125117 [Mycena haematopus]
MSFFFPIGCGQGFLLSVLCVPAYRWIERGSWRDCRIDFGDYVFSASAAVDGSWWVSRSRRRHTVFLYRSRR